MDSQNITIRKQQTKSNLNLPIYNDSDESECSLLDTTIRSLPESSSENYYVMELKSQIEQLTTHLEGANQEIDNLNLENGKLKKIIEKHEKTINAYKKIDFTKNTSTKIYTPKKIGGLNTSQQLSKTPSSNVQPKLKLDKKSETTNESTAMVVATVERNNILNIITSPSGGTAVDTNQQSSQITCNNQNTEKGLQTGNYSAFCCGPANGINYNTGTSTYVNIPKINVAVDSEQRKKIYIIGDAQATGLSSALIYSRVNKWNDQYQISGFVQPEAPVSHIVEYCKKLSNEINLNDKIILAVGSNDTNPQKILCLLSVIFYLFKKNIVYVLQISYNRYLNINLLNNKIKVIINNHTNCYFIQWRKDKEPLLNASLSLKKLCNKINIEIDSLDYKQTYLNFDVIKSFKRPERESLSKPHKHYRIPKKGTIPYYFKVIKNKANAQTSHDLNTIIDTNVNLKQNNEDNKNTNSKNNYNFLEVTTS